MFNTNKFRPALTAVAIAAFGLAGAGVAQAQNAAPQQGQAAPQDISDSDLENFASAVQEVQQVQVKYQGEIEQAADQSKKAELQEQAQNEMVNAIQNEGLTVERYQQVAQAIQQNPELWEKVEQHLGQ